MSNNIYGWLFTKNPNTGNWRAFKRDDYLRAFSEPEEHFLISKSIKVLEELIEKTDGDQDKIDQLLSRKTKKTSVRKVTKK